MLPVKDMQHRCLSILVSLVILLSGCTASVEEVPSSDPPLQLSFSAETLDRVEDGGSEFNLKETLEDKPVLVLWVAAGCSGWHDWTKMIRESISNGSINASFENVVSIHRWAEIESSDQVMDVFGLEENNSYYSPWPIVLPKETDMIVDFETGNETDFSVVEGFNSPGTPTVQLIGQDGVKMWQSKSYWANFSVLQEAWDVAEMIST